MNRFRLGLAVILLLLLWAPLYDATPARSEISSLSSRTKPDNPDYRYVEGELTISGALLAYWHTVFVDVEPVTLADADKVETLYLRFYPKPRDSSSMQALAEAVGQDNIDRIFLYRSRTEEPQFDYIVSGYPSDEPAAVEQALEVFPQLPAGFMEHREGYAVQAVSLTLFDIVNYVEGGHRFTYARARDMKPLDEDVELSSIPDLQPETFLGLPWRQEFFVSDEVVVRASPHPDGEVVAQVPASTMGIEKLQTLADGWVRVRLKPEDGSLLEGYLPASQLWIIN